MIISVASGKGGTGKTTVSVNLAASIGEPVTLLDCDVEQPNAHLFLDPVFESSEPVYTPIPVIDGEKCNQCGKCVTICRFNAIANLGNQMMTFPEMCHGCGGCVEVCPEGAITESGRELGWIQTGHSNGIRFVHGRLRIGEAMAPPLIHAVMDTIDPEGITFVDAPPGTSCPMVASIHDSDVVVLVTEPTPFGLHDLKLAVEVVRYLKIPHGLILNKSGIGTMDHQVRDFASHYNIPILIEIPFDRCMAETYCQGRLLIHQFPEWQNKFRQLFQRIVSLADPKKGADLP